MLGVRTEAASLRSIAHTVRAVGTVAADERRIGVVNPKFEGWIEKLLVNTTGQTVRRGEALLEVYSPDLVPGATRVSRRPLGSVGYWRRPMLWRATMQTRLPRRRFPA